MLAIPNAVSRVLFGTIVVGLIAGGSPARASETPGEFVKELGQRVVMVLQRTEGDMDRRQAELAKAAARHRSGLRHGARLPDHADPGPPPAPTPQPPRCAP